MNVRLDQMRHGELILAEDLHSPIRPATTTAAKLSTTGDRESPNTPKIPVRA